MRQFFTQTTLLAFILASTSLAYAQGSHTLVDILVKHWDVSKSFTLAVADAMPADDYSFKAASGEMSFGEQMNHIAKGDAGYCSAAFGTTNPLQGSLENTKESAKKNLTTAYDLCINGLKKMDDSQLMKTMGKGGRQATVFELLWGGFTHSAHHRGQAEVYLRLKGITPPKYQF